MCVFVCEHVCKHICMRARHVALHRHLFPLLLKNLNYAPASCPMCAMFLSKDLNKLDRRVPEVRSYNLYSLFN